MKKNLVKVLISSILVGVSLMGCGSTNNVKTQVNLETIVKATYSKDYFLERFSNKLDLFKESLVNFNNAKECLEEDVLDKSTILELLKTNSKILEDTKYEEEQLNENMNNEQRRIAKTFNQMIDEELEFINHFSEAIQDGNSEKVQNSLQYLSNCNNRYNKLKKLVSEYCEE